VFNPHRLFTVIYLPFLLLGFCELLNFRADISARCRFLIPSLVDARANDQL